MAALATKLTLKKGSTTESVTSYSVESEGTVKTASGGTTWPITNNGVKAYIGLWPVSVTSGGHPSHSMLKVKKNNVEYYVEKTVNNNYTLKLAATTNQTITLKYTQPGASEVTKKSSSSAQSFSVEVGTTWTATIAAASGYKAGKLSATSGTVKADTTVSATAATTAYPKGTLIGNNVTKVTIPATVTYISINAIYSVEEGNKGGTTYYDSVAIKRVQVTPGTTYSNLNTVTGYNTSGFNYAAGEYIPYCNHANLGKIPANSDGETTQYKIYADTSSGTPYSDAAVRAKYQELTGSTIPK